jgi:hypothetical protein
VTFTRLASLSAIVLLVVSVAQFQNFRSSDTSAHLLVAVVALAASAGLFAAGAISARRLEQRRAVDHVARCPEPGR